MDTETPSTSAATSSSESTLNILILNDDCLQHTFQYLKLDDLCAVADVCSRFRENAQMHFSHSNLKDLYKIRYCTCESNYDGESPDVVALRAARVLRNFGTFIKAIELVPHFYDEVPRQYHVRFAQLLNRYCPGTLEYLMLRSFLINNEVALLLKPVLASLLRFSLEACCVARPFVRILPKWAPKLQVIKIFALREFLRFTTSDEGRTMQLAFGIQPDIWKLEHMCLERISNDVFEGLLEGLLRVSPQLKRIELKSCEEACYRICQSIVAYAPQIENLQDEGSKYEGSGVNCMGQLRNLKSLTMGARHSRSHGSRNKYIGSVLRDIAAADIPLQYLHLNEIDFSTESDKIVAEISKMKKLRTLQISDAVNLKPAQFLAICKNLTELTEIYILKPLNKGKCEFTSQNLLTLIEYAPKLQVLSFDGVLLVGRFDKVINTNTFTMLVKILRSRAVKAHLKIILNRYTTKKLAPDGLLNTHNDLLTIEGMAPVHVQHHK